MDNIQKMQARADDVGLRLRPHIKTHKMPAIAEQQVAAGAHGIAVATLPEARAMQEAGFTDIQVANEVIHPKAIQEFRDLSENGSLTCAVDSMEGVQRLNEAFRHSRKAAHVLIEIDTGLHRAGVMAKQEALALCRFIEKQPNVQLKGLMTHGGQSYGAADEQTLQTYAQQEQRFLRELVSMLETEGFQLETVSIGATPLTPYLAGSSTIKELRVGNYVFYDRSQVALGTVSEEQCALTVLATVISVPTEGRAIIDAGSKALTTDQGAHCQGKLAGFGKVLQKAVTVQRVSEEHGVIEYDPQLVDFQVGEVVQILPNHACPVVNLFNSGNLIKDSLVTNTFAVKARGHSH